MFNMRLFKQQQLLVNLTMKKGQGSEDSSAVWSPGPRLLKMNNLVGVLLFKDLLLLWFSAPMCCTSSAEAMTQYRVYQDGAYLSYSS